MLLQEWKVIASRGQEFQSLCKFISINGCLYVFFPVENISQVTMHLFIVGVPVMLLSKHKLLNRIEVKTFKLKVSLAINTVHNFTDWDLKLLDVILSLDDKVGIVFNVKN